MKQPTPPDAETNFANYPQSVAEARAITKGSAQAWTPRDALIYALRAIDSGEIKPDSLVAIWREPSGPPARPLSTFDTNFVISGDTLTALGLLTIGAYDLSKLSNGD